MNRSLAVFVGFLMTLPAYAYDTDDYVTPASVAYVKGAYDALAGAAVTGAGTGLEKSATSPYTLGVKNGGIGATQLATSAVETAKIKDLNVTTGKLAANAVTNAKIADNAVTLGKIDSTAKKGATDTATYSGTGLTTQGYVDEKVAAAVSGLPTQDTNTTYAAGTGIEITGNNNAIGIKSSGVTATQLATSAVTTDKINAGAVTSAKLATSAVETAKIKDLNVTTGKLAANAVTNAKIADSAVTLAKIDSTAKKGATDTATYPGTGLTTQGYVDEKVAAAVSGLPTQDTNTTYAAGTGIEITGTDNAIGIKSSGVTATQLATSAVTADKINAGAVTSAKLGTSAVVAAAISAGAVVAAKLGTSAVTSDKINASAVTNAKIADSAVTLAKIDSTAKKGATDTATYSGTGLTTQGYVDEKVATAVSGLPTQDTNTTYAAGNGVTISGTNNAIAVKPYNGITVDGSGVGVKLDGTTLSVSSSGVKVNEIGYANIASGSKQDGATTQTSKLATTGYVTDAVATATSGLQATITAGNGLSKSGATLSAKAYNGITVNSSGVSVKPYNGINVSSSGVGVKLDGTTLSVSSSGVKVNEIGYANIASGSKQDGATTQTSKLATTGYVTDAITSATSNMATQDGVRYTLKRAVMTVPVYSGWGQSSANLTVQDVQVNVATPTYYTTAR